MFFVIFSSLLLGTQAGLVRVPKIYNAIVSSKQNLSPSQAVPLIEPVYRTTALGVLFPPLVVHSTVGHLPKVATDSPDNVVAPGEDQSQSKSSEKEDMPEAYATLYHYGSLYPVAIDPYFSYSYQGNSANPTLPIYQQPFVPPNIPNPIGEESQTEKAPTQGVKAAIDFQKNPEVPDVPTPPLPVKNKRGT